MGTTSSTRNGKPSWICWGSTARRRASSSGGPVVERRAVDVHLARAGREVAGQGREQRRLAGAVGPDQRDHLARPHLEVDVVEHRPAAEVHAEAPGGEDDVAGGDRLGHGPGRDQTRRGGARWPGGPGPWAAADASSPPASLAGSGPAEQPEEERAADEGGEHPEGDLGGRRPGPGGQVGEHEDQRAAQRRGGEQHPVAGSGQHAHEVRDDEADEGTMPDTATEAAVRRATVVSTIDAEPLDVHAEVAGLPLPQRQQVERGAHAIAVARPSAATGATIPTFGQVADAMLPRFQNVMLRSSASSLK